jgi:uncharacterized protein (DUF2141 family)
MKKWLNIILIYALVMVTSGFKSDMLQEKGTLSIQLKNIRKTDGVIYVFLYNYENQYPRKPLTYYSVKKDKIVNGALKVNIENVAYHSNYAIALVDDENNNDDLDRILGIPTEGFGFSNNVRPLFSLPNYKELLFSFTHEKTINIDLQYFL